MILTDAAVRYLAMYYIRRTRELLEDNKIISLAEALGECKTSEEAKSAPLWARDHDFEYDDQGYSVSYIAGIAFENLTNK